MRQAARGQLDPSRHAEPRGDAQAARGPAGPPQALDLAALRRQVSIQQVLGRLGYLDALRGPGPQRRGPCPLQDAPHDPYRCFSVHLAKGGRCFHPDCRAQGNTLDLWAAYHRLPLGQAAHTLAETFAPQLTSAGKSLTRKKPPSETDQPPTTEKTAMGKLEERKGRIVDRAHVRVGFLESRNRGVVGHWGELCHANDHGLPFWYMRGWDPKLPYPAQVVRQSAGLL